MLQILSQLTLPPLIAFATPLPPPPSPQKKEVGRVRRIIMISKEKEEKTKQ